MGVLHAARTSRTSRVLLITFALSLATVGALQALPGAMPRAAASPAPASGDCLANVNGVDLNTATLTDLEAALASGEITSVQLVDAYTARVAAFDSSGPGLNAIQVINPNARAEAAQLDAERAAGHLRGPLHGVAVLLKDNVGTNDMPTTAGSIALANNTPPLDATLTERLRAQGVIILGKTHLSEFANWVSLTMPNGYSSLGGQVHNAYTGGDPSGSSAGSGVAGSMAMASITIGTETSGSILSPSDANSLVGVKPTTGLVSRAGVIPLSGNFDTPGPMGRNVADDAALLGLIAGPDPRDPKTAESAGHLPPGNDYTALLRTDALVGVRLGYDANNTDPIFLRALDDLRSLGATVVEMQTNTNLDAGLVEIGLIPNDFKYGINNYLATEAGPDQQIKDLTGIILYNQMHPDKVKYGQDLLIASDLSQGEKNSGDAAALAEVTLQRTLLSQWFGADHLDAILAPGPFYANTGAAANFPTVIVPAGYNGKTPEGISFFGQAWSEPKLLAYAYAYEQGTHRREPPTTVNASLLNGVCPAFGADGGHAAPAPATHALAGPTTFALPRIGDRRAGTL
ncbi:MAG: amidase family protein [Thermoplasmatota archaeon]